MNMGQNQSLPEATYKVYNYTFLQSVSAEIFFEQGAVDKDDYWNKFKEFSKKVFNIEPTDDYEKMKGRILISSGNNVVTFRFEDGAVRILINREGYKCFEVSLRPCLENVFEYLKAVANCEKIDKLVIKKVNVWPITLKEDVPTKQMLNFVFRPEHTEGLDARLNVGARISKEAVLALEDKSALKLVLSVAKESETQNNFILESVVSYEELPLDQLIENAKMCNMNLYNAYMYVVSEDIISMMNQENKQ